jgi:hypothetical protein
VAIAMNPKTSFADGMVFSSSCQFDAPIDLVQHFVCQGPRDGIDPQGEGHEQAEDPAD